MQDVPERLAAVVHNAGRHEAAKLAVRDAERLDVSRSEERGRFRPLQRGLTEFDHDGSVVNVGISRQGPTYVLAANR